jgi:hypothetical protein
MILAQLIWTDKRGGWHIEQGQAARLAKKLETLRRPADSGCLTNMESKSKRLAVAKPVGKTTSG